MRRVRLIGKLKLKILAAISPPTPRIQHLHAADRVRVSFPFRLGPYLEVVGSMARGWTGSIEVPVGVVPRQAGGTPVHPLASVAVVILLVPRAAKAVGVHFCVGGVAALAAHLLIREDRGVGVHGGGQLIRIVPSRGHICLNADKG